MDTANLCSEWQYVERNGNCLNIDEKMRIQLAVRELRSDLCLDPTSEDGKVWLMAKVTGKCLNMM